MASDQNAVVPRLGHDDPREELAERRRVVEELQEREARQALDDGRQDGEAHRHDRPRDQDPARQVADHEPHERLRQRAEAQGSARHRVLSEPQRKSREAAGLGAVAQRQQHRQHHRQIGDDAPDPDRRHHRGLDERPPADGEHVQG